MIQQIFAVIAPVFLIAALGYVWGRRGLPFDNEMVTQLVTRIGAPCLFLSTLLARRPDLVAMLRMVAAATAVAVICGMVGFVVLRTTRQPLRVYLPALIFANTGNMGLPLTLFAFGEDGLAMAVAFFAATSLLQFTIGVSIASGRISARGILLNPVLWAIVLAVALLQADVRLPPWIMSTIDVIAGFVIPLMLMSLGTSLARLRITAFARSLGFSVLRIGLGFGVAVAVVAVLGLTGPARGAVIIQSAMPTAVFNYLFAVRYDNQPGEVAGIVVMSTLISFATLPLLLAFALGP